MADSLRNDLTSNPIALNSALDSSQGKDGSENNSQVVQDVVSIPPEHSHYANN